jgi:hypothetical protein
MSTVKLSSNPLDLYSIPIKEIKTKLTKMFAMKVRDQKTGREMGIVWDSRKPLIEGFENKYSYIINFKVVGNTAGNHYHNTKQELLYPLIGSFRIILEDIKTKQREEIEVHASEHKVLYFPTQIAHAVIAQTMPAIILVTASFAPKLEDEIEYKLT